MFKEKIHANISSRFSFEQIYSINFLDNYKALQSKQTPHLQVGPSQSFNSVLKDEILIQFLRSVGSLFQSKGPEYFNDLSPNVVEFTWGCKALLP